MFIKEFLKKQKNIREIYEVLFGDYIKQKYSDEERSFIALNGNIWKNKKNCSEKFVVVEFSTLSPDNFLGVMKKACAYREKYGYNILALLDGANKKSINNYNVIKSFGVDKFFFKGQISTNDKIKAFVKALIVFIRNRETKKLLDLHISNEKIGDCIYDTIIRSDETIITLDKLRIKDIKIIYQAFLEYKFLEKVIAEYSPEIYITAEYSYLRSIKVRLAVSNSLKTHLVNEYSDLVYCSENIYTTPLALKNYMSREDIIKKLNEPKEIERAEKYFRDRINGKVDIFDAKNSFQNNIEYSMKKNNKNNVVICAHIFSDSMHCHTQYVFKDYYEWFVYTIENLYNENINLYIKLHPSSEGYGEWYSISKILDKYPNVQLIPNKSNTKYILENADIIITAAGTIALEAACMGIPSIIVCDSYYNGFGVVDVAETIEEYNCFLSKILLKGKNLDDEKLILAKLVLYNAHKIARNGNYMDLKNMSILPCDDYRDIHHKQYKYINEKIKENSNCYFDKEYYSWLNEI